MMGDLYEELLFLWRKLSVNVMYETVRSAVERDETLLVNAPQDKRGLRKSAQEILANFLANGLALLVGCARFAHISAANNRYQRVCKKILRFNYR